MGTGFILYIFFQLPKDFQVRYAASLWCRNSQYLKPLKEGLPTLIRKVNCHFLYFWEQTSLIIYQQMVKKIRVNGSIKCTALLLLFNFPLENPENAQDDEEEQKWNCDFTNSVLWSLRHDRCHNNLCTQYTLNWRKQRNVLLLQSSRAPCQQRQQDDWRQISHCQLDDPFHLQERKQTWFRFQKRICIKSFSEAILKNFPFSWHTLETSCI